MKIRGLFVENFRKFRDPMRLEGFADGLNLVCEANEAGKSTVLEAMRAVLFERHNSKGEHIKSLRPYDDDVAPVVELSFEIDGAPWTIHKRFLRREEARLTGPSGERLDGEAAEERLQQLLGFTRAANRGADDESRGALGLFWVEQGAANALGAPGQSARRTLQEILSAEVGAVTGGKRAPAVLNKVTADLEALQTRTGVSRGPLKEAEAAREAAEAELRESDADLWRFGETLDLLDTKRGELRRLEQDAADGDLDGQEASLAANLARAQQAASASELAKAQADAARQRRDTALALVEARRADRKALADAQTAAAAAERAVAEHGSDFAPLKGALVSAAELVETARKEESAAGERRDAAAAARDSGERSRTVLAAFQRLKQAQRSEIAFKELEETLGRNNMTEAALAELEELDRAVASARAAFQAGATRLLLELTSEGASAVTIDGSPVTAAALQLIEPTRIEVRGIGAFVISPPTGAGASSRNALEVAEADLESALLRLGEVDLPAARACAAARRAAATELELSRRALMASCPADPALPAAAGLATLRAALAGETRPTAASGDATMLKATADQAEAQHRGARTAVDAAIARREAAAARLSKAEAERGLRDQALAQALADRDRRASALASVETEDEVLERQAERLAQDAARASADADEAERTARILDPAIAERKLKAHRQHRTRISEDRSRLTIDIARLEEGAKTQGGAGPAGRVEAAREALALATADVARLSKEAAVLRLLKDTLKSATAEASRRFLQPVVSRVDPLVRQLIPSASLSFGEDMRPRGLIRGGRTEDAHRLSRGTQEQLAVLTRLAFAQMIIDKGRPASVILDDALVYSDDARFETMLDILAKSAERLQIIVLTCRASLFRRMDAVRLGLCE